MDEGERAEEEQRSGDTEDDVSRADVPDGLPDVDGTELPAPVGLGVPAELLREHELEEEEQDVGDKMELLFRAFL